MPDFILVRTPISAQKSGFFMPATATSRKTVFADTNFPLKNPEKQGVFDRMKKHEKNIKKPLALKSAF